MAEQLFCKQQVGGSSPLLGSILKQFAEIAKWSNAGDCKSPGLAPSGVRIPLSAPLGSLRSLVVNHAIIIELSDSERSRGANKDGYVVFLFRTML